MTMSNDIHTTPRPQIRILPDDLARLRYDQSLAFIPCYADLMPRPGWDELPENVRLRWATVPDWGEIDAEMG